MTKQKPLLKVVDCKKWFPTIKKSFFAKTVGNVKAVNGVSFEINRKETLGLVGESGCGKTTIGKLILRLLPATEGKIFLEGKNILTISRAEMRKTVRHDIQVVFQNPTASLNPRKSVGFTIGEPLSVHGVVTGEKRHELVKYLLEKVGLREGDMHRYPHELSGGQKQRVCVARALALRPKFIVCDEPTSALDVSIQSQIINLFKDLQDEYGLSYLFISHNLSVIRHISDKVAVMYSGKIVEFAIVDELFNNYRHPYTKALISAIPVLDLKDSKKKIILKGDVPSPANLPSGCNFRTRCNIMVDLCREQEPELRDINNGHFVACHMVN